jgi:hypothetical protein
MTNSVCPECLRTNNAVTALANAAAPLGPCAAAAMAAPSAATRQRLRRYVVDDGRG